MLYLLLSKLRAKHFLSFLSKTERNLNGCRILYTDVSFLIEQKEKIEGNCFEKFNKVV